MNSVMIPRSCRDWEGQHATWNYLPTNFVAPANDLVTTPEESSQQPQEAHTLVYASCIDLLIYLYPTSCFWPSISHQPYV
jgi:hypothetical protein